MMGRGVGRGGAPIGGGGRCRAAKSTGPAARGTPRTVELGVVVEGGADADHDSVVHGPHPGRAVFGEGATDMGGWGGRTSGS
jgi:hypothetical protein